MHPSVSQSRRRMNIPTMKKKVLLPPYPISIELYNAVPQYQSIISSTTTSTTDSSTSDTPTIITRNGTRSSLLYRPEYSTKWLSPIHLEISILDDHDSNSSNNNSNHQHQQSLSDDGTNGITTTTTTNTNTTKQITPQEAPYRSINENNGMKPSKVILYRSSSSVLSDLSDVTHDTKHHRPQHPERFDTWSTNITTTTTNTTTNNTFLSSFVSTWYHIADTISEDQLLKLRTTSHIYETICARFATIIPYHHRPQHTRSNVHSPIRNNNNDDNNNNSELPPITTTNITASNQCDESPTQLLEYRYFLEMNIHPSRLCRIPPSFLTPTTTTTNNNSNNNNSNHNNMIYDRLPINCVIVRFSDQTIRIHPSQYQLLDSYYQFHNTNTNSSNNNSVTTTPKKNHGGTTIIIDPSTTTTNLNTKMTSPLSPKIHVNNMSLSLNGSFFEDDVFHTLDDVTPNNNPVPPLHDNNDDGGASNHVTVTTTTTSMYDDNDRRIQHHDRTITNIEDCNEPNNGTYNNNSNNNTMDKLSFLSLLDSKGNFEIAVENHVDESSPEPPIPPDTSGNLHHGPNDITVNGSIIESDTIRNEIDFLEALIQKETAALSHETQQLKNDTVQVRSLMDQIRNVEEQNRQILPVLYQVQMQEYRDQFILEAQRIRLIRDVARIYPITVVRNVHYSIHGLEIPFDLYSGMVSEEVISAAFGFLCHTTFLISKYLGIHIRYRLHCQSSRSAIQDTNGSTYPLFPGRQVEREQFEYAVHLLHRNIDCICKCRGIQQRLMLQPSNQIHILAKILRIYDNVNDGY